MSAKSVINLQDGFLNQIRKDNILTTVYLVNGFNAKAWSKVLTISQYFWT